MDPQGSKHLIATDIGQRVRDRSRTRIDALRCDWVPMASADAQNLRNTSQLSLMRMKSTTFVKLVGDLEAIWNGGRTREIRPSASGGARGRAPSL